MTFFFLNIKHPSATSLFSSSPFFPASSARRQLKASNVKCKCRYLEPRCCFFASFYSSVLLVTSEPRTPKRQPGEATLWCHSCPSPPPRRRVAAAICLPTSPAAQKRIVGCTIRCLYFQRLPPSRAQRSNSPEYFCKNNLKVNNLEHNNNNNNNNNSNNSLN